MASTRQFLSSTHSGFGGQRQRLILLRPSHIPTSSSIWNSTIRLPLHGVVVRPLYSLQHPTRRISSSTSSFHHSVLHRIREQRKLYFHDDRLKSSPNFRRYTKAIQPNNVLMDDWTDDKDQSGANQNHWAKKNETYRRRRHDHHNSSSSSSSAMKTRKQQAIHMHQMQRWEDRQRIFFDALSVYQNLWKSSSNGKILQLDVDSPEPSQMVLEHWTQSVSEFQHPSVADVSWEQLIDSEPHFARLCSSCHDCFAALASIQDTSRATLDRATSGNVATEDNETTIPQRPWSSAPTQEDDWTLDLLMIILSFWERLGRERGLIADSIRPSNIQTILPVESLQHPGPPKQSARLHQPPSTSASTNTITEPSTTSVNSVEIQNAPKQNTETGPGDGNWMGWLQSLVGKHQGSGGLGIDDKINIDVTTHMDPAFIPNDYHYTKVIGRLYFSFPKKGLNTSDWYQQRAAIIQRIVDEAPSPQVLSNKMIRLLVRAYQDIGTLEASRQAEAVYNSFPSRQERLLWYVLMSYLQVTQTHNSNNIVGQERRDANLVREYDRQAATATKRVCDLLLSSNLRVPSNERQSLMTVGFLCLSNTPAHAIEGYFDLVESLARRKFGNHVWQLLLLNEDSQDSDDQRVKELPGLLKPNDPKTLQLLIQIYSQPIRGSYSGGNTTNNYISENSGSEISDFANEEKYLRRAQQLLETAFAIYDVHGLKDSIKRSTFHAILSNLIRRKNLCKSEEQEHDREIVSRDLDYALDNILDRMILTKSWWPNEDTWHHLFQLAETGPQMEKIWFKYEICHGLTNQYALPPLRAARYALNAWAKYPIHSSALPSEEKISDLTVEKTQKYVREPRPVREAWKIFRMLETYSMPYFFAAEPHLVKHIYCLDNAPDEVIYTLVWKICHRNREWETALKVYEIAKKYQKDNRCELSFSSSMYTGFLRCLYYCPDEAQKRALTEELYDDALENDKVGRSFNKLLKGLHPDFEKEKVAFGERDDPNGLSSD